MVLYMILEHALHTKITFHPLTPLKRCRTFHLSRSEGSSPKVHPQQACSDQSQPLGGLPVRGQHDWHDDDLPGVCIVELLLAAAGRLVSRGHKWTNHRGLLHTCSHPENKRTQILVYVTPRDVKTFVNW